MFSQSKINDANVCDYCYILHSGAKLGEIPIKTPDFLCLVLNIGEL